VERYRDLYNRHWWWRARTEFIVETLKRYQPPQGWGNILDVGCGDALFFERLSQFGSVEGIEPDAEAINSSNRYFRQIYNQPFDSNFRPGKRYSLILMLDVIEHLADPAAALEHLTTLLEPAGLVIATVPAFRILWTNHDLLNHHVERYTKSALDQLLQQSGLRVLESRYFYHWTFGAKLVVRAYERMTHAAPAPASVPSHVLNEFFYWLSRLEQKTLSQLQMPFGSSLMAIACRAAASEAIVSE